MRSPVVHNVRRLRRISVTLTLLAATACATLLAAGPASGLVLRMSADKLTDTSATVVVAKATATASRWTDPSGATWAAKGTIVTDVRLAVYEVLKGEAPRTMAITVPGGSVGKVSIPVEDAPQFAPGQMYVVFLASSGQVVAWREGQPEVVGARVPALGLSLAGLKSKVAARTGHPAKTLRSWSGVAPSTPVAPQEPAQMVSQSAAQPAGASAPGGVTRMGASGATLPAGASLARTPAAAAPRARSSRSTTTLFSDDFESLNMNKWTLLYHTPVVTNETYFSNSYWEDNQSNDYMYAYSAAQKADYYLSGMWFWELQMPYPGLSYYGNNDSTWMITKNAINLSNYAHAILNFDLWLDTAGPGDQLGVWFSTNGTDFSGPYWYGQEGTLADPPDFAPKSIDLNAVPTPGGTTNFCGHSQVWIAFQFQSDSSGTAMGGCVDNVDLEGSNTPIPVISSIDPPSAPAGTYYVPSRNQSRITITGSGFGSSKGDVAFYYQDGKPMIAGKVRSWSNTSITCDVPIDTIQHYAASAGSGPVYVVTAGGAWSGGYSFDVPYSYGNENWEASRCFYRINTSSMNAGDAAAIDAATSTWNNVGSRFLFQDVGTCTTKPQGSGAAIHMPRDGHNDMCFADASGLKGVIAFASPLDVNGRMLEVDIVFNTGGGFDWNTNGSGSAMDVQTIATHETGHWLNLRDLYGPGNTGNIMYGFCDVGIIKRTLTKGERDGIDWIYATHGTDTKAPVTQAKSLTVKRGKTAKIKFAVNDPAPSIGVATAHIAIVNRRGKTVKKTSATVYTRFVYTWSFTCKLAKGRYSIVVTGADQLGHAQSKIVKGTLTVK